MSTPSGARHTALHYTDQGSGPPVVLVHGVAGGIVTSWGSLLEQLAEHHRVIAIDNPGSGNSPLPDGSLQLDAIADSIALTAEHAGLERYTVVGSDALAQGIKGSRLIRVPAGHDAPAEQPMAISAHIHALTHR
ncbi:alpha/beta fold hydrolase [Streptomyces sp. Je 1-4]|uniref:alpha/beta fold hydrolase n=1 Tax=Streptomyces TaxID=1883 RepID=UPI00140F453F|nr:MULTISPECIES: alpha/beta fold hydrolase [unclassified Streptomyces]QIK10602.1 alpha/beta fold hydrolase [Streptomyces sp. ID38640]UYB44399.1 alpha/beta fold hydrolase [Streptomyces sp. Je 1-4]UZQ40854.1 alpha/beta fold hydrolase [Streptomyces sp. Je 1-4] [Streptomyces sp. Je 1-4 4N24]UZQ48271.1 alpha/beta fold hydrolase [Streptomyces sp. Je 1-4] [Streptomyces sp. Je 1-4 4N24_ara]